MKVITIFMTAGLAFTAAAQSTSSGQSAKTAPAPAPLTIPKDATPTGVDTYRYVDKDGKQWIYRKTPYGVTRTLEHMAPSIAIPKDAKPQGDGSYRYVDKDGTKWIYRQTPFGVSKAIERDDPPAPAPRIEDDPTQSEDLGDSVRFTRATPFGPKVWTTRKSDLSEFEKSIWNRDQRRKSGGAPQGAASKPDTSSAGRSDTSAARQTPAR